MSQPPPLPQPQDRPLSREPEYIPGQPVLLANLEEGWMTRTSEHDFDPEVEAAAIPYSPVQPGQVQAMEERDRELEKAREREAALRASSHPLDRLKVYMDRKIWAENAYRFEDLGGLVAAERVVDDVIEWLREHEILPDAWDAGFAAGTEYLAECCGCNGRGPTPANPYEEAAPPPDMHTIDVPAEITVSTFASRTVRIHRGL